MIDLGAIFNSILYGSNEERNLALENYQNSVTHQPNEVLQSLVHVYTHSPEDAFRSMAVIYLKKLIISQGYWDKLSGESKELIKNSLFESLKNETKVKVRNQLHDTIAEVFVHVFKKNEWTDVLDKLSELISSQNDYRHREAGFLILGQICSMEPILMRPHLEVLKNLSTLGLEDSSTSVQISTLVALTGFISATRTKSLRKMFQPLIPKIINVLTTVLNSSNIDEAFSIIQIFHDWVEMDPLFFKPYLSLVTMTFLEICKSNIDEDIVDQTVMVLSTMISSRTKDMLSINGFLEEYISILMNLLLRLDDYTIEEWNALNENERTSVSQSEKVEANIDNLSNAVGGEILLPHMLEYIQTFVQNPDWKYRHSGIMALGLIIEGCKAQFLLSLHDIVNLVVSHMSDPHPRVRWVATHTLGSLSSDLSPKVQLQFPHLILPALAERLDETNFPKIQKIALISLRVFCTSIDKSVLLQYLDDLLKKLYTMLSVDDKEILEECVSAIAAIANKSGENFTSYYDTFTPYIKYILNSTQGAEYRILRGKTFECITLIGVAVGKEKFLPDANEILSHLQATEISEFGSDDSNSEFLLESAARICAVLKEDFIPFLPSVMPLIFKLANMEEESYLNEFESFPDSNEYMYRFVDGKKIGIHTATLEIKSLALQMLYTFIKTLKEGISDYYFEILDIILPLLSFRFYKDIRATTTTMLYPLIKSIFSTYKSKGNLEEFMKIFNSVLNELIGAFIEELEIDLQAVMCEAIAECISVLPEGMLPREQTENVIKIMLTIVKEFDTTRNHRLEEYQDEYDDEADYIIREREEEELNVMTRVAEVGGVLARKQINTYLPVFESILNFIMELVDPNNHKSNRYLGFTLLDDAIENSNGALNQLIPHCLPLMIDSLADDDIDLVQSACIGVGICAQRGGEIFSQYLDVSLKAIANIVERNDIDDEDKIRREELRDTAVNSFGKVLAFQQVNQMDLFSLWLSWLPLTSEPLDARECHKLLVDLAEQNNSYIWGEYYKNLPKVLEIFAYCISDDAKHYVLQETVQKIHNLIAHMKNDNLDLFNQALQTLSISNQEILSKSFSS